MPPSPAAPFALPPRLAHKSEPALIGADAAHLHAVSVALSHRIDTLSERLERARRAPGRTGQQALDRDQEVHRLTAQLRTLRRFGLDLCLGRIVPADGAPPVYIGRLGLTDDAGERLLVDWRTPAAEPFFAATYADPKGLASRRRYRWSDGRITDYWDEAFVADAGALALDDDSAFIASLATSRTERMRDVLGTIQADQDAIIRADSRGALVVDGGPGTGKTVVALHRAAYLLYSDPRLGHRRGGLLFVGPHRPYLHYVADVLPSLGEEGVLTATLRDLVPQGATAGPEPDARVARLKSSAGWVRALDAAVALYEEPPTTTVVVETPWGELDVDPADWAAAFDAVDPGTPHNEARDQIWAELAERLQERVGGPASADELEAALRDDDELSDALTRAWPLLDPLDVVGDLWTVPAYLRRCAPWLSRDEVAALQRPEAQAWTVADLPLIDAARQRLGDPHAEGRRRRQRAAEAAVRDDIDRVVDLLIESDDSEHKVMSMLRGADADDVLVAGAAGSRTDVDPLAGPFAHIVVDEAQELTDAQWQMLLTRCPSRSVTVVGDRAQARHGFAESWQERLQRVGLGRARVATLTVNYRTPAAVMAEAEPVIRAAIPDAVVPTSIRQTDEPVHHGSRAERDPILEQWLAGSPDGIGAVIGDPTYPGSARIRSLTPELAKGLEFDLVVLVDPDRFGDGIEGAVDRYVAMTRTTGRLVILTTP